MAQSDGDLSVAADCLKAFADRDDSDEAHAGAMLLARFLVSINAFLTKK